MAKPSDEPEAVEPIPVHTQEKTMADSNFAATPYPTYNLGGDDDSVQHAILTSHAGASVERNQDAGFSAGRSQLVHRDVVAGGKDARIETLELKFELANQVKNAEIRNAERFSELKELILGQAARDLAEARADLRAAKQESMLSAILEKLAK